MHLTFCQLLLVLRFLTVLKHGVEGCHTLLHVVSHYLVESKTERLIKLLEEIGHEVLQQAVFVVELQEGCLMHIFGFRCLEFALIVNT